MGSEETPPRNEGHRLSISEERLRYNLSELEWRLRAYFDEQLRHKADIATVEEVKQHIRALERGDFTPSAQRALTDIIESTLAGEGDSKWKGWQRIISVCAIMVAICSFILTAAVTLGGAG
jgi:hypothetical protein